MRPPSRTPADIARAFVDTGVLPVEVEHWGRGDLARALAAAYARGWNDARVAEGLIARGVRSNAHD